MGTKKITAKANFEKTTREEALVVCDELVSKIQDYCERIEIVGSIRRNKDMIGDIDMVVIPKIPIDEFIENVKQVIEFDYGKKKKIFGMFNGRPINIFVSTVESFGACIYQTTGPALYNIYIRQRAKRKGMKLNEYGLFTRETDEKVAGATEESIFHALELTYIEPTERKEPEWVTKQYSN
jgi:DNA polymerase (family 10)